MSNLHVLVTGANGFVGQALCAKLQACGCQVTAAVRQLGPTAAVFGVNYVQIANIDAHSAWQQVLNGVDVVVHLAARVHVMQETVSDPLGAFREVNVAGTQNLARQAAQAGVKRFIFLSSIKVLGEGGALLNADSPVEAQDAYAASKWEAEQCLWDIARHTGMEVVIMRPPLIYGPGVKGNFLRLLSLVKSGLPLPLASVQNLRTLLSLENCCSLIWRALEHPAAAGQTLLLGDLEAISTPQLLQTLADALGVKLRLWPFPVVGLKLIAQLLGKRAEVDRLCDSLQINAQRTYALLEWQPPLSVREAIKLSVQAQ